MVLLNHCVHVWLESAEYRLVALLKVGTWRLTNQHNHWANAFEAQTGSEASDETTSWQLVNRVSESKKLEGEFEFWSRDPAMSCNDLFARNEATKRSVCEIWEPFPTVYFLFARTAWIRRAIANRKVSKISPVQWASSRAVQGKTKPLTVKTAAVERHKPKLPICAGSEAKSC